MEEIQKIYVWSRERQSGFENESRNTGPNIIHQISGIGENGYMIVFSLKSTLLDRQTMQVKCENMCFRVCVKVMGQWVGYLMCTSEENVCSQD